MSETIDIRVERADQSPGRELIEEFLAWALETYGPMEVGPSATADEMAAPGGTFLVIYEDGQPVACGGVKRLSDDTGEIKRMYVREKARSRGHARRLLAALENAARELGYRRVKLDTGHLQPHALALYASEGYREIPDYNDNPYASYWGEKEL